MLEGQADQILLAGISSLARRLGSTGETLDLNTLSLVPSGSAEHIPYMTYLARGRDVDTPAVIVLLDGDDPGIRIAEELRNGYRGTRYVDDEFIIQTNQIQPTSVHVATDAVRERLRTLSRQNWPFSRFGDSLPPKFLPQRMF